MQKKAVIIAVCLLAITLLAVACNKKDKKEPDATNAPIDYTIGEDGEKYITNVYGDLIPVTTSKDGSVELIEDLMTKTKEQAEKEKTEMEEESMRNESTDGQDSTKNDTTKTSSGGIQVGNDNIRDHSDRDAVIVW